MANYKYGQRTEELKKWLKKKKRYKGERWLLTTSVKIIKETFEEETDGQWLLTDSSFTRILKKNYPRSAADRRRNKKKSKAKARNAPAAENKDLSEEVRLHNVIQEKNEVINWLATGIKNNLITDETVQKVFFGNEES